MHIGTTNCDIHPHFKVWQVFVCLSKFSVQTGQVGKLSRIIVHLILFIVPTRYTSESLVYREDNIS